MLAQEASEGVDHQRPEGVGHGAVQGEVAEHRQPHRGEPERHARAGAGQRAEHGAGRPLRLEADGREAERGPHQRQGSVVLLEGDREAEQHADPREVAPPAPGAPGEQPLQCEQGEEQRIRGVEGPGPGREGPDARDQQRSDADPRPARPRERAYDPRRDDERAEVAGQHGHARDEDARLEEAEETGQQEPDAGRNEGVHVAIEHIASGQVQRLEEEVALVREDDPTAHERPGEGQHHGAEGESRPAVAPAPAGSSGLFLRAQDPRFRSRTSPHHSLPRPEITATRR